MVWLSMQGKAEFGGNLRNNGIQNLTSKVEALLSIYAIGLLMNPKALFDFLNAIKNDLTDIF